MSNVKVTTELDDKASPGLQKLKGAIDGVSKSGTGLSSSLKDLSSQFSELATSGGGVEGLAQGVSSLTVGLGGAATAIVGAISGLKGYEAATEAAAAATLRLKAAQDAAAAARAATQALTSVGPRRAAQGSAELEARNASRAMEAAAKAEYGVARAALAAAESHASLASAMRFVVPAASAVGTAIVAAYTGMELLAFHARAAADDTAELADKMGLTIGQLEALTVVANENGTSVESLQKTFDKLSKSMNKADEDNEKAVFAFESLGISMSDLAGKSEKEVAGIIIKNYELLNRSTAATAAVMQLLGPAFREQIPAIKEMAEGIIDADARVKKFGAEATPELIKAGGEQERALTDLGLSWKGFGNEVAASTGSALKSIAEFVTGLLNNIRLALKGMREARAEAASTEAIPQAERNALLKQATQASDAAGNGTQGDINARFKALLAERKAVDELAKAKADFRASENRDAESLKLQAKAATAKPPGQTKKEVKELRSELEGMVQQLEIANKAFGMDDSVKQGLEARKKYAEDIKKGIDPKYAAALLKQAEAAIAVGAALKKAAEEQKAFEDAKRGIEDYEAETEMMAYEATLIGKTADERERLLSKFREEVQLRKTIAGLGETDVKNITDQTRAAMESRDAAKKALEDSRITNEVISQSYGFVQEDVTRRIQSAKALLESGKITVDDYVKYVNSQTDRLKDNTKQNLDEMQAFYAEAAKGIQGDFQSFFFDIMEGNMTDLGKSVQKTINSIIAQMLAAKAATALFGSDFSKGNLGGYAGQAVNFLGGLFGGARATGGPVEAGRAYMVGERGPEPFIPKVSGTILPNSALQSSGPQVTVNLTAIDTKDFMGKMNEVKRELAGLVNNTNRSYRLSGAY